MRGLTLATCAVTAIVVACGDRDRDAADERTDPLPRFDQSLTLTAPELFLDQETGGRSVLSFEEIVMSLLPAGSSKSERADLVKAWLVDWAARRPGIREKILCPWLEASTGQPLCRDGDLDLAKAPFKAVAVVNRMDLHDPEHCEDAGELRIAFAWVDEARREKPLMLVFEYAVPTHNLSVAEWAERWLDLENLTCTSADCDVYRREVELLVETVVEAPAPGDESESFDDEVMMLEKRERLVLTKSMLRHVRIHDRALGGTAFLEYDLDQGKESPRLVATDTPTTGKCQGCHTGSGPSGERFNLNPGVEAGSRLHPDIMAMMPVRAVRLPELRKSECAPVGGEVRSVPW